jgi:hypothetical protein
LSFEFPLEDMTLRKIDAEFLRLPEKVKQLVNSSTRKYNFGGRFIE